MAQTDGICAIVPWGQEGLRPKVLGMGILVGPRELVTCAHVVDTAVDGEGRVRVCFPHSMGIVTRVGRVDRARYVAKGGRLEGAVRDVAVVVLEEEDAPVPVVRLVPHREDRLGKAYGFRRKDLSNGEWISHPDGEWAEGKVQGPLPGGRVQLDGLRVTGARVERGFSGGAVYDGECDGVVGMVVTADVEADRKTAQFIGVEGLWRVLGQRPPTATGREQESRYLKRLLEEIERKAKLYAPLEGIAQVQPEGKLDRMASLFDGELIQSLLYEPRKEERRREEYADALDAFRKVRQAAILGAPGAGKSTTLRRLAADWAKEGKWVPLLLTLGNWRDERPLGQFVAEQAPELAGLLDGLAKEGRLALLLDGLNEMPTGLRGEKAKAIRKWVDRLGKQTPVFVSCRLGDYTGDLDLGLDTLTLQELQPWRVREVLRLWVRNGGGAVEEADRFFWQLAGDEGLAGVLEEWKQSGAREEEGFWLEMTSDEQIRKRLSWTGHWLWRQHVRDPRSLVRLAANPFLLTMLFLVWRRHEGEMPRNRGELFDRFVDGLLAREGLLEQEGHRRTERGERLVAGLTALAWQMQTARVAAGPDKSGDFGVLTVVSKTEAKEALGGEELLKRALDATLLEGEADVRFRHQLLQEYFTAVALRERMGTMRATELWPAERWWQRSGWEEAAILLAGLYGEDCSAAVRWVAAAQPEVAADCLLKSGAKVPEAVLKEWKSRCLPLLTDTKAEPRPEARAAIGRALGRLKLDDREGVGVRKQNGVPDIHWVEIPEGTFLYQGKPKDLHRFKMARYPVTNAQFDAFVQAEDGYRQDCWWEGMTDPDRERNAAPRWSEANHPRVDVNWYEAMAFCAWLAKRLNASVLLPREEEWERASSFTDGRDYPWGKKYKAGYANIDETAGGVGAHYLGQTSPVGMYPDGKSRDGDGDGVMDLAGNVWEWCLNEYKKPERTQKEGTEPRVLRGGSWILDRDFARAGYRGYFHPSSRGSRFGFRVVCSSPIPGTLGH